MHDENANTYVYTMFYPIIAYAGSIYAVATDTITVAILTFVATVGGVVINAYKAWNEIKINRAKTVLESKRITEEAEQIKEITEDLHTIKMHMEIQERKIEQMNSNNAKQKV